jgi:pyrroline-5-carboxylate reductase
MNAKSVGFLGGGRITRVILSGWEKSGMRPAKVVVSDVDAGTLAKLQQAHKNVDITPDNAIAAAQEVVFLALHPPLLPDVLTKIAATLNPQTIVVSLAPKLTIAKLTSLLGGFARLVRVIPNAPSIIGAGFNPTTFGSALTSTDHEVVRDLLCPLGICQETVEEKLEAYAVLTAMGPTYFWPLLYELIGLGMSFGLSQPEAEAGLRHMLAGTVETLCASGLDRASVQDLVPVRPLADVEQTIIEAYRTKLTAVFEKIRP